MKIRIGDFGGQVAPTTSQRVDPRAAFVDQNGGLADAAMRTAGNLLAQDRAETKHAQDQADAEQRRFFLDAERERMHNEQQAARNKAASAFASYQVDSEAIATSLGADLVEGKITRDDAAKALDTQLADLKKSHLEPLDAGNKAALEDNLIRFDGKARAHFGQALQQNARQERAGAFSSAIEQLQRLALTDRAGATAQAEAMFSTEGAALMGKDKATKGLQQFKEQVTFTDLDRRISAASKSGQALKSLEAELAKPEYADLAPERRNFLESKIQRNQQNLAHQGEIAERRRLSALDQQQRRLSWYVENGKEVPKQEFDAFVKAAKGTPFQGAAEQIVGEQKAVSEFMKLPPSEMVAKVKALEKSYGDTPSREQLIHLDKVKRFADRSIKLLNDSPLDYAVSRDGAQIEPIDLSNPQDWASNLTNRTAVLTEQSKRTGAAPKGLFPQEVQALAGYLREAPVKDKSMILASLRRGFGDDKVFRATMQQIAPDNPALAVAGIAAGRGLEDPKAKAVSDQILRGQMILHPSKKEDGAPGKGGLLPMPKDDLMLREFESYARDAFAGHEQARNAYMQTARSIYAAKAVEDGDYSGNLDTSRWRESMQMATGGIDKHNGRRIVLPWGMSLGDFKDGVKARAGHLADRLPDGVTPAKLADLPLENAGDGKYVFRAGDGIVYGKDHKPIVLDFNEPMPFVPSGAK